MATTFEDRFDPAELSEDVRSCFFIDGKWQKPLSQERMSLISPLTEEAFLDLPVGSADDMAAAVDAAARAFAGEWPRLAPSARAVYLRKMGDEIRKRTELLKRVWTAQVGVPVQFSSFVMQLIPSYYDYYADLAETYPFEETRKTRTGHARILREPVGVCALITPWNAPLILLTEKVTAALLAGCTVVAKPSPETPLEALILAECAAAAGLPAGVFNVVPAGREAGDALVRDARIDKVSFTGSTAAGKHIGAVCADRVARVGLELGGKSAAIICDDADLNQAFRTIVPFSMPFSGQICFAQTRLLVSEKRHDEFVKAYVSAVKGLKVGDPWEPDTATGPLATERQLARVLDYLEVGVREGAKLLTGGGRWTQANRGYFVQPTVFDDVTPDMRIAQEEIFGPVVSIIRYKDEEDAIRIANDSLFGLSGTVFSGDVAQAEALARRVRTGFLSINGFQLEPNIPLGGYKQSGIGREGGPEGLSAFQEVKAIYLEE